MAAGDLQHDDVLEAELKAEEDSLAAQSGRQKKLENT